jgi:hypothetical protein
VISLIGMTAIGCGGGAWDAAVREDTPVGYYRFMRDHPDSPHHVEAQERLDFHKLKRDPSLAAYEAFQVQHPASQLLDLLRPQIEPAAFDVARAVGTAEAYHSFSQQFPGGPYALRADGNAVYVEAQGFGGDPDALARFAASHPDSDFAAEAKRSAEGVALREQSQFARVGLVVEISPATPEADRLRKIFRERALELYEDSGIELVDVPDLVDASTAAKLPTARLRISHAEAAVQTSISNGEMSRPGMLARTLVSLRRDPEAHEIFEREFTLRVDSTQHLAGHSVLFSSTAPVYWDAFFVPVASWQTNESVRPVVSLEHQAVDVDAAGDRSVVLYEDGSFQLLELADPSHPVILAEYTRPNDFKKWSGVSIIGSKVALFGEDGLELVGFGPNGAELEMALSRSEIGTIFAAERLGDQLILAGARGLLLVDRESRTVKRVMRRVIKGLALVEDDLIFTDGESLYVSNLSLLSTKRVSAQMKLGKGFGPERVRAFGPRVIVIGRGGVMALQVREKAAPVVTAKLPTRVVGRVHDATAVGNRIFLLGDRGLQMMDRNGVHLAESIDVADVRLRVAKMGRHIVSVGSSQLQVVDSTPLISQASPATVAP